MRSSFNHGAVLDENIVWVEDLDLPGSVSVTNDAENVVAFCLNRYGDHPIMYSDSEGYWDMLEHDGEKFTGFRSLGATTNKLQAITNLKQKLIMG